MISVISVVNRRLPIALALALLCAPCGADNPRVSLKIAPVTAQEAARLLSQASGVPVEVTGSEPAAAVVPKAGFEWSGVTFARALRDLCRRFDLQPTRRAGGYLLIPLAGAVPGKPPARVGLWERDGLRLFAREVSIDESRAMNFVGEEAEGGGGGLTVQVFGELGAGDAERVSGIENARARDDLGNVMTATDDGYSDPFSPLAAYPDEWVGSITFERPHPKARKLAWVEGDLMAFRTLKALRVEVPLPLARSNVRASAGDWLMVVSQYQAEHKEPEDDDAGLPPLAAGPPASGPSMRVRVYHPAATQVFSRSAEWGVVPMLVGATGRIYPPAQSGGSGAGDGQMSLTDYRLVYPVLDPADLPAKLVWSLAEKSDPYRLCRFRLENIPIPAPAPFVPRVLTVPAAKPDPEEAERPFFDPSGGVLTGGVEAPGGSAADGKVTFGLAERRGTGWGPVRWMELAVGADGILRLENVKPGEYRVLRVWRSTPPAAPGRWVNGDVTVRVDAGKKTALPALQWEAGARAPAARSRPATGRPKR